MIVHRAVGTSLRATFLCRPAIRLICFLIPTDLTTTKAFLDLQLSDHLMLNRMNRQILQHTDAELAPSLLALTHR